MFINGFTLFSPKACYLDKDFIEKVIDEKKLSNQNYIELEKYQTKKAYRRMDRFSLLVALGVNKLFEYYHDLDVDEKENATILNTAFGPVDTNIQFISDIHNKSEETLSPTLFSHTVNNAALGHICKEYKLKGPSTQLLSSNGIAVSEEILNTNKSKQVMYIGAETYSKDLYRFFDEKQICISEMVAILMLSNKRTDNSFCEILSNDEMNLWGHPYLGDMVVRYDGIDKVVESAIKKSGAPVPDIVYAFIMTADKTLADIESNIIKKWCPNVKVVNLYHSLNEMLGAGLNAGIAIASVACKKGQIELEKYCLINTYDISGNYISVMVRRVK